jgi:hypothetical protein
MKYRILIQKIINTNQLTLVWYMETGNTPWETDIEANALEKYKELLRKYPSEDLTLVSHRTVTIDITAITQGD